MDKKEILLTCDLLGRNATKFIQELNGINGNIWIEKDDRRCNAKSLIGLLSMCLKNKESVFFITDNPNSEKVFGELNSIISALSD